MDVRLIMELQCERFVYLCPHSHMFPEVELLCSGCSGKEYTPPRHVYFPYGCVYACIFLFIHASQGHVR